MKKIIFKIFMISLFTSICFFGIDRVYAETTGLLVNYDNAVMDVGSTWTNSSTNKKVNLDVYYSDAYSDVNDVSDMPLYIRQTYCSTSQVITDKYFVTPTNIRCYTGGYSIGRMYFVNITFNHSQFLSSISNPSDGVSNTHYAGSYNLKLGTSGEFTFYGSDVSRDLSSFPTYSADSEILDDLDSLKSLVTMIQGDSLMTVYYLEKIYDLFKCEQVNLFDNDNAITNISDSELKRENGGFTFTRASGSTGGKYYYFAINGKKGTTYTFSAEKEYNANVGLYLYKDKVYGTVLKQASNGSISYTLTEDTKLLFTVIINGSLDNYSISNIQVEKGNVATSYLPYGQCRSMIDTIKDSASKSAQNSEEIKNYVTDDTAPDTDISSLGTVSGLLPEGPVDSLLNLPFYFLSIITSSFGGICVPLEGTFVFNSTLTLPCFSDLFYSNVPTVLMTFINLIPSAFILLRYFKHLYKKVDRAVSMNSNSDDEWGVL